MTLVGSCDQDLTVHTLEDAEAVGQLVATTAGCGLSSETVKYDYSAQVKCMRAIDAATLFKYFADSGANASDRPSDLAATIDGRHF